jgi:hypothetical protein
VGQRRRHGFNEHRAAIERDSRGSRDDADDDVFAQAGLHTSLQGGMMFSPRTHPAPGSGRRSSRLLAILSLMALFVTVLTPAVFADSHESDQPETQNAASNSDGRNANSDGRDPNADDGSDNADDGSDNADDGSDNADDGSDNADDGSQDGFAAQQAEQGEENSAGADDGPDENANANATDGGDNAEDGSENANEAAGDDDNGNDDNDGNGNGNDTAAQGNRGSFKLKAPGADSFPPGNDPHLPCTFEVHFYQYEADAVMVDFDLQAPSGSAHLLGPDRVVLERANDNGLTHNGSQRYDLQDEIDAADAERHDQQGYHIRISVTRDVDTDTANAKQKVFWVDCGEGEGVAGDDEEVADLLVDKVVSGEDAPTDGRGFTFTVTCDDQARTVTLSADAAAWSWNDDAEGADDLTEDAVCSIVENDAERGDTVVVRFNGTASGEGTDEELDAGDNTFVVDNRFGAETGAEAETEVGGVTTFAGPAIDLAKSADVDAVWVGEVITYTYVITNTGNVEVTDLTLDDDQLGGLTDLLDDRRLAVGEAITVSTTHTATADDVGVLTNVAIVTGIGAGDTVRDTAQASVEVSDAEVLGSSLEAPTSAAPDNPEADIVEVAGQVAADDQVAAAGGEEGAADAAEAAGNLPRTGTSTSALALFAIGLLGMGTLARLYGHRFGRST